MSEQWVDSRGFADIHADAIRTGRDIDLDVPTLADADADLGPAPRYPSPQAQYRLRRLLQEADNQPHMEAS